MSRQLISSEKFPPKPHNCECFHERRVPLVSNVYWSSLTGPAVKVPGLVFCAGQTATGEIKQATVRLVLGFLFFLFSNWVWHHLPTDNRFTKPQGSSRTFRIVAWTSCQVQCLPRRHERFCCNEWGIHRFLATAYAITLVSSSRRARKWDSYWDRMYCTSLRLGFCRVKINRINIINAKEIVTSGDVIR